MPAAEILEFLAEMEQIFPKNPYCICHCGSSSPPQTSPKSTAAPGNRAGEKEIGFPAGQLWRHMAAPLYLWRVMLGGESLSQEGMAFEEEALAKQWYSFKMLPRKKGLISLTLLWGMLLKGAQCACGGMLPLVMQEFCACCCSSFFRAQVTSWFFLNTVSSIR